MTETPTPVDEQAAQAAVDLDRAVLVLEDGTRYEDARTAPAGARSARRSSRPG